MAPGPRPAVEPIPAHATRATPAPVGLRRIRFKVQGLIEVIVVVVVVVVLVVVVVE